MISQLLCHGQIHRVRQKCAYYNSFTVIKMRNFYFILLELWPRGFIWSHVLSGGAHAGV